MSDQLPANETEPLVTKAKVPSAHLETLFNYLVKCIKEEGAPPTYDDIGKAWVIQRGWLPGV